jgi:hypothetical protein
MQKRRASIIEAVISEHHRQLSLGVNDPNTQLSQLEIVVYSDVLNQLLKNDKR